MEEFWYWFDQKATPFLLVSMLVVLGLLMILLVILLVISVIVLIPMLFGAF